MQQELMQVGTRVKTTEECGTMPIGTKGVIKKVDEYNAVRPYKVLFDGDTTCDWMFDGEIEVDE